jgi:hypothetical protein
MNKRKGLLFAGVAGLLLLNLWRWWPTSDSVSTVASGQFYSVDTEKFRLLADPPIKVMPMERNPFEAAAEAIASLPEPVIEAIEPTLPPYEEQESLAPGSQDEAALGHLKLGGVVYRKGGRYAYLLESGKGHLVGQGSVLFGRYRVEEISVRSVTLKDMTSGNAARLFLSAM